MCNPKMSHEKMNVILGQMKRNLGYWLISSDRNGGYAYAKVCSNGILASIMLGAWHHSITTLFKNTIQQDLMSVSGTNGVVQMETYSNQTVHSRKVVENGKRLLNFIKFPIIFEHLHTSCLDQKKWPTIIQLDYS